jgi:uncharacterized protein with HEPN domain
MSHSHIEFIRHILEEAEFILNNTSGINQQDFLQDAVLLRATIRSLEIIGEACKNVPEYLRQKYPEIYWKEMAGTRDKLIHHYFGIDYDILWDIIKNEIPLMRINVEKLIEKENI